MFLYHRVYKGEKNRLSWDTRRSAVCVCYAPAAHTSIHKRYPAMLPLTPLQPFAVRPRGRLAFNSGSPSPGRALATPSSATHPPSLKGWPGPAGPNRRDGPCNGRRAAPPICSLSATAGARPFGSGEKRRGKRPLRCIPDGAWGMKAERRNHREPERGASGRSADWGCS